jgi:hypothetical protein
LIEKNMEPMRFNNVVFVHDRGFQSKMRKILMSLAAAGILLSAAPAIAEDMGVSIGEHGVSVGADRGHDRDIRRDRADRYEGRSAYGRGDCREITVKKRMPDGSVAIRKSQRC